ncbi:MAG: antA/AntB antirepressor family protein [Xanthomonadales bacterium]|nr:antA/AntB antirepressor family protein [Xanthomonadales bacterium]
MTSNSLVPVFTGQFQNQSTQLCNARDLHTALEVGDRFDQWIRRRISEYSFTEGEDFCTNLCKTGGRPATDYHLTLDMAKELAMLENNPIGRQVRRYFIQIEKKVGRSAYPAATMLSRQQLARYNPVVGASSEQTIINATALLQSLCAANLKAPHTSMLCEVISAAVMFESSASDKVEKL